MRIIVIGLGSMGKRRIRLIQKYNSEFKIVGVDSNVERCREAEDKFHVRTESDVDKALKETFDCAFIATSPLSHAILIEKCLESKCHVFTELNLVSDSYEKNISLAKGMDKVLFLSSTFLYREEISYIKEKALLCGRERLNYTYHVGQYLPDWHPWESYNEFFVGNKRTNGCREIFAIELPWLIDTFGKIKQLKVVKNKNSELNVDYPDNYLLLLEHESGAKGLLAVDVISRKAVRNLEVFGENLYISWNGNPDGLKIYDLDRKEEILVELYDQIDVLSGYSKQIIENVYFNEVKNFFDVIAKREEPRYSFEKDRDILTLIDEIEQY